MRIFTSHEKTAAGFKYLLRMFVFGILFSVSISISFFYLSYSDVNNKFVKLGFPKTTFKNYLVNKILKDNVFFKLVRFEPELFFIQKGIMNSSVDRVAYNRILENLFKNHSDPFVKNFLVFSYLKINRSLKNGVFLFILLFVVYILYRSLKLTRFCSLKLTPHSSSIISEDLFQFSLLSSQLCVRFYPSLFTLKL